MTEYGGVGVGGRRAMSRVTEIGVSRYFTGHASLT